ncbi:MAG: ABC transporter ATP-binding protein [Tuberibacillus sp.]
MVIKLKKVVKTFGEKDTKITALKGITLTINKGEFVAIVGKSGSGKSTLINMITGIDQPSSGTVEILGTNINKLKASKMARWRGQNIGIIFQFFQLMPTLNVLENVMLPMDFCGLYSKKERIARANGLLKLVGLADEAKKFPSEISGGQQQRAAIARALANDPPIIVADEPTGSLDTKTSSQIITLFESLATEGKTVVIVTHDLNLAERADRKITVIDGSIVNGRMPLNESSKMKKESV